MRLQLKLLLYFSISLSFNCFAQNCIDYRKLSPEAQIESLNIAFENEQLKQYNKTIMLAIVLLPEKQEINDFLKTIDSKTPICADENSNKKNSYQLIIKVTDNINLKIRNHNFLYKNKTLFLNKKDITNNPKGLLFIDKKGKFLQRQYYDCFKVTCKNKQGYVEFPFYKKDGSFAISQEN